MMNTVNTRSELIKRTYSYTEMSMNGEKIEYTVDNARADYKSMIPRERHRVKRLTELHQKTSN